MNVTYYLINYLIPFLFNICTGYSNFGLSGSRSGNASSGNLSEECETPESSLYGGSGQVLPNKRKKSMLEKVLPSKLRGNKKRYQLKIVKG